MVARMHVISTWASGVAWLLSAAACSGSAGDEMLAASGAGATGQSAPSEMRGASGAGAGAMSQATSAATRAMTTGAAGSGATARTAAGVAGNSSVPAAGSAGVPGITAPDVAGAGAAEGGGAGMGTGATGASAGDAAAPTAGTAGGSDAGSNAGGDDPVGSATDAACTGPAQGSMSENPLFSDQYTADPGALVDGCTFYIHCGHDEGPNSFVLREWFVLSSTDMVHWTKQVALRVSDFGWADANAWAGQVVKKGDKYYWFAPVQERGGGMAIGVAVADSPTGPFRDAIGKPLINDAFEMSNAGFGTPSDTPFTIDPTVWVEEDGQAWLHYGGFSRMMVAKLSEDMLSIDGTMQEVTPRGFFEAAYLFKHEGKYYEVYAAGSNPATIDYSTSDSPMGPWTYGGRILDALPNVPGQDAATSHPAVAQFAGQWYLVYHLSNGPNGGGTYKREVAIEKLTIEADGSIPKVTPSQGLQF